MRSPALAISFVVLAVAWRKPRYDATPAGGPPPPGCRAGVDSTAWQVALRVVGHARPRATSRWSRPRSGPADQPDLRDLLRLVWVGLVPRRCCSARSGRRSARSARSTPASRASPAAIPSAGSSPIPTGSATGRPRSACSPSCGWSWSTPTPPSSAPVRLWCALYLGVMLVGGAAVREHVLRPRRPLRGLLLAGVPALGLGSARRRAGDPQPAGQPRHHRAPARAGRRWSRCSSAARPSTRSGTPRSGCTSSRPPATSLTCSEQPRPCSASAWSSGLLFCRRPACSTGVGPEHPRRTCPTLFAHSVVPIIVGYFVAHYLTYFLEVGQATLIQLSDPFSTGANWSAPATGRSATGSPPPDAAGRHQGAGGGAGHVVGVIAAHDRAIALLPRATSSPASCRC